MKAYSLDYHYGIIANNTKAENNAKALTRMGWRQQLVVVRPSSMPYPQPSTLPG
jgi:hypothetical protein